MIDIQTFHDEKTLARETARVMADLITDQTDTVLGLATGSTPVRTYAELARLHREEGLSFKNVVTFNLDEYRGLPTDHSQSYRTFMNEHLFKHVDIPMASTHVPDGSGPDPDRECEAYEAAIEAAGGIDFLLLGIGRNGHIAFNEPGSGLDSRTRVVSLSPATIAANSRFFESAEEVPREAITAGIGTILDARRIVLLAAGPQKAEAVRLATEEDPTETCPASCLQDHPDCAFFLDDAAAANLSA